MWFIISVFIISCQIPAMMKNTIKKDNQKIIDLNYKIEEPFSSISLLFVYIFKLIIKNKKNVIELKFCLKIHATSFCKFK